jgi:Domain of unknown function (DUF5668)
MRDQPNPGAIVAGVLFIVLGVLFLLDRTSGVSLDLRWVWPFLLIGLGIAGLMRSRAPRS